MKNKGLEDLFEKDDWLTQQRRRESRISFWDLDDAKKVRMEHEQDCDVKENADMHHQRHLNRQKVNYASTGEAKKDSSGYFWFVACIALMVIMVSISGFVDSDLHYLAVGFMFLGISPVIIFSMLLFKRFPGKTYWFALFAAMFILEAVAVLLQILG